MYRILEDRTEDNRLPRLSHFTMGLSFIRSSIILTYGTSILLTYRGIKLLISGLEDILFSLIPVTLSSTGGSFVVLYTPDRDIFFFFVAFLSYRARRRVQSCRSAWSCTMGRHDRTAAACWHMFRDRHMIGMGRLRVETRLAVDPRTRGVGAFRLNTR